MSKFYTHLRSLCIVAAMIVSASMYAQTKTIGIEVKDISPTDATAVFTPSDNDFKYCWGLSTKYNFYEEVGGADAMAQSKIDLWKVAANAYGISLADVMANDLASGVIEKKLSDLYYIHEDTDYVLYAFGVSPEGELTTAVAVKEFSNKVSTITINVKDITPTDATAVINPSANNLNYYWGLTTKDDFTAKGGADGMVQFRINIWKNTASYYGDGTTWQEAMSWDLKNGPVEEALSERFDPLTPETDYVLYAFGMSPEGELTTPVAVKEFTNKTPANTISIELKDEEPVDATVLITPSDNEMTYYWGLSTLAKFEATGGAEKVVENRLNVWKNLAASWDDGTTWQEVMSWDLKSGVTDEKLSDRFDLYPGNDYIIYAFGIDAEGELTAPVTMMEYSTVAAVPSDNTFTLTLISVQPDLTARMSVKAKVVPSNTDKYTAVLVEKKYIERYDLTPGSADEVDFINNYMLYGLKDTRIYTGEQTVEYTGITADADVCLFVMGVDDNNAPSTGLTRLDFKTERFPNRFIELEVSDISPMNAHIKVTPSDPEMRYYIDIAPAYLVEEKGGEDCIAEKFIIDWWKYIASMYEDTDWTEFIEPQTRTGALDTTVAELVEEGTLSNQYWGEDWVLYAVGFSTTGEILTPTATSYYSAPSPETSDLSFEFEFVSAVKDESQSKLQPYTATVNIFPSRTGEEFKVNYTRTSVFDSWVNNEKYGMNEYIKSQWMENAVSFTDAVQLKMPGLYRYADFEGTEQTYTLTVMGWNEGPTTKPATYVVSYKEGSGLTVNKAENVTVTGGENEITVSGRCGNVVVYNTAGQVAGVLRGAGKLQLPAGIYVVRYDRDGKPATCKVVVR